jgi:2-keto-4-pentenoate hydratase/2-oxohepta-3-ene-1,7-dioic acid hydratase in catechol pathway
MRVYLGLTDTSLPHHTRIFADVDGKLVDLVAAHAQYRSRSGNTEEAHRGASFYFPETIAELVQRDAESRQALKTIIAFARQTGLGNLSGPGGERTVFDPAEIRILPPLQNPERSFVIGFSDRARTEAMPEPEIPTGFYKLPQTFVTSAAPIVWPKFSQELDADACLALVIGKAGKRIDPAAAWDHIAGVTLLIDITARDINRREGLTTNNLLGKNFPSSTCLGPAVLLHPARSELEALTVQLTLDGEVKQQFTLRDCVFTLEQIVARWSIIGLKPGDFLAIGASMARAGARLQNPVVLKAGSELRCSSPAIGELAHRVIAAGGSPR